MMTESSFVSTRSLTLLLILVTALNSPALAFTVRTHHISTAAPTSQTGSQQISSALLVVDATLQSINGEKEQLIDAAIFDNLTAIAIDDTELLPEAPPVTYKKFITMQDKRVVVTIRYSAESGLRPYFLTVAKKLKESFPDVIVERRILPAASVAASDADGEATFEILVDGTVVVGKTRARRAKVARVDMSKSRSVYVSMQELDVAIARARRRRRPSTTVYGDAAAATGGGMRKEMLREKGGDDKDDAFL